MRPSNKVSLALLRANWMTMYDHHGTGICLTKMALSQMAHTALRVYISCMDFEGIICCEVHTIGFVKA